MALVLLFNAVLAFTQCVPKLDAAVSAATNNLWDVGGSSCDSSIGSGGGRFGSSNSSRNNSSGKVVGSCSSNISREID